MRRGTVLLIAMASLLVMGGLVAGRSPTRPAQSAQSAQSASVDRLRAAAAGRGQSVGTTEHVHDVVSAGKPLVLRYPGVSYVKVHLGAVRLAPGWYLTVADRGGSQRATYRADGWTMSVDGDAAVLTLHGPGSGSPLSTVDVDRLVHGFTAVEWSRRSADQRQRVELAMAAMRSGAHPASVCGSDDSAGAVCYRSTDPVAYLNSRAVALLLIDGDTLCTAWRVGPNNRMFTNHHCFTSSQQAQQTEVWFNDECVVCGGTAVRHMVKVNGDQVLATDQILDFTLFTVTNFAKVAGFGYLSLDVRDPGPGEELYIPQHPNGVPTVIAMSSDQDTGGNCAVKDPSATGYASNSDVSYYCDTAGGSSGSPVISRRSDKVIALHHFGGCPNSGVRIDLIYQRVASLIG
jgi:hypothetical protein